MSMLRCACTDTFQRRFGFISILGFTCTILITWEGSLMYVGYLGAKMHMIVLTESKVSSQLV